MRFLVIGSGLMGSALAYDLARSKDVQEVLLADIDLDRARKVADGLQQHKVHPIHLDVTSQEAVQRAMKRCECAIGAVSYRHNESLSRAAIGAGVHFCDLGGNDDVVAQQRALGPAADARGVTIVPNCGLAPGLVNILAARGAEEFDSVDSIHMRVGGLPRYPQPPFNYQIVFSVEGLLNEYTGMSFVIRAGKLVQVESMTGLELLDFPAPVGHAEAFHTSGGASALPEMFEGKVRNLDYKTVRYPGHCEKFRTLLDLGFASSQPIQMGSNMFTERELFLELIKRKLPDRGPDIVVLRVEITGFKSASTAALKFEFIDFFDDSANISAMMRSTAYPTSLIAQYLAQQVIRKPGVWTPEQCVPLEPLLGGLEERGIRINRMWERVPTQS